MADEFDANRPTEESSVVQRVKQFGSIAAMAALLIVAAGCSSDDNGVEAGGGNQTEQTDGATATTASSGTDAPATTAAETDGTDSETTPSFTGEDSEEFCGLLKKFDEEDTGGNMESEADYNEFVDAIGQLQAAAPAEINDDVDTFATSFKAYADLYKNYGYDADKADADPKSAEILGDDDFTAASERISVYTDTVCGLTGS
jgi:hypothetical protein